MKSLKYLILPSLILLIGFFFSSSHAEASISKACVLDKKSIHIEVYVPGSSTAKRTLRINGKRPFFVRRGGEVLLYFAVSLRVRNAFKVKRIRVNVRYTDRFIRKNRWKNRRYNRTFTVRPTARCY